VVRGLQEKEGGLRMTTLKVSVHVAPPKFVVSDDLPPGEERRMWSPTSSILISGESDAILVDPLLTIDEARVLTDWVVESGKNVTTILVTHAHGDHFFGAPVVLDKFPNAEFVAAPSVVKHMEAQWGSRWFDNFWKPRFPDQISEQQLVAKRLPDDGLVELEGEELHTIELGHTDTDGSSALYMPSIGVVVAGDAVYGDVHIYLAEAKGTGIQDWLDAIGVIEALGAVRVVSGHKRDGDPDSPEDIGRTRRYIEDFNSAAKKAHDPSELYETMVALYPGRLNRGVLWNSANAFMT
jgi:glyoxylase-like metal-dependent hydrolase (beta-lactamase superfamily II)